MLRILIDIQYVVYTTSFTAQQKGTCCTFCKTQRNESLHKTAKKGKVAKDLEPKKSNWSISFSHFSYCFPHEFVFFFKFMFPISWSDLSHKFQRSSFSQDFPVGSMLWLHWLAFKWGAKTVKFLEAKIARFAITRVTST